MENHLENEPFQGQEKLRVFPDLSGKFEMSYKSLGIVRIRTLMAKVLRNYTYSAQWEKRYFWECTHILPSTFEATLNHSYLETV